MPPPDATTDLIRPMRAVEGEIPTGSQWAFEFLWDGQRAVAYLRPGRVRLLGPTDRSLTATYPELAVLAELADRHGPLVLDGTVVAYDRLDRPSAPVLRRRSSRARVEFFLADVLRVGDRSTLELPYGRRRDLLNALDLTGLPVRRPPSFLDTDGHLVLGEARSYGLDGVLAKRWDSVYQPGRRSRAWVQTVSRHARRVVLGGWRPGARPDQVDALLVGAPAEDGLRFLALVRPDAAGQRALAGRLDGLTRPRDPFHDVPDGAAEGARWLRPALVGEIAYRRVAADGRPRQATWRGLCPGVHAASVGDGVEALSPPTGPPASAAPAPDEPDADLVAAAEASVRQVEARNRALRAQISPHFLYNTLTTLGSVIRTDQSQARDVVLALAEYYRYSLREDPGPVTLGEELANARRYLEVAGARFGDRLRVLIEVPEALTAVPLPFLGLQRPVEHAVQHGVEGAPAGGTVRIAAAVDGADCVLTASEDASTGAPPPAGGRRPGDADAWSALLADLRERLRAGAGPAGEVRAEAGQEGTTITLRLPVPPGRLAP